MAELFKRSNTTKEELKKLEVREAQMERKVRQLVLEEDHKVMLHLEEIHFKYCHMGQRNLIHELKDRGYQLGRKRVRRLMKLLGIEAMVPQSNTSKRGKSHKIYPYFLRDTPATAADEVWCTDITYRPMRRGHAYLIAVMDWHTRAVISWKVCNTMDTAFCLRALRRAFHVTGRKPKISNTDQGSQLSSK